MLHLEHCDKYNMLLVASCNLFVYRLLVLFAFPKMHVALETTGTISALPSITHIRSWTFIY